MPRDAGMSKNKPPLIDNFAVQRADGAELALHFYELVAIEGAMPAGGKNRVEVAVCSIPALLAMKGHALKGRHKQKDSYDIYYCIRNYPGGPDALAQDALRRFLEHAGGEKGIRIYREKSSVPLMTMDPLVFDGLSRTRRFWGSALPTSGNKTHSDRSTPGLKPLRLILS